MGAEAPSTRRPSTSAKEILALIRPELGPAELIQVASPSVTFPSGCVRVGQATARRRGLPERNRSGR